LIEFGNRHFGEVAYGQVNNIVIRTIRKERNQEKFMVHFGTHPSQELADDPGDIVWRWFIFNGPHGNSFEWRRNIGGQSDLEALRKFIEEKSETIPDFKERAKRICRLALKKDDEQYIRKGIHILTILGNDEDMISVQKFVSSPNPKISNDAVCGLFERGIRIKKKKD
jgi:hypothetical protein